MVDNITTSNSPQLSDQDFPGQGDSECFDHDGRGPDRTRAVLMATAYILLAAAGPEVWFLPWNMAQLGWIAGPAAIILFSFLTCIASIILCDFYYSPDSTGDKKNHTYMEVIQSNLGGDTTIVKICWVLQFLNLLAAATRCIVLASKMMADMQWVSACKKNNNINGDDDHSNLSCWVYRKPYFIVFGVTQLLFSQIPNFDQLNSLVILCFGAFLIHSSIGVGLSLAKITNKYWIVEGSLVGIKLSNDGHVTRAKKTWMIFEALGSIAGAFDLSSVLLEVEDTIRLPVQEAQVIMRKAIQCGLAALAYIYLFFGCLVYAAFGDEYPGFIFPSAYHEPPWLLNIASAAVAFQYAGLYQVFVQPIFAMFEKAAKASLGPDNEVFKKEIKIWIPIFGKFIKLKFFRLVLRTFFVILTTLLPMFLEVYVDILDLIEILVFWPIVFYFPVKIYIMRKSKTPMWSCARGLGIQIMSFGVLIVSIAAAAGDIANVFLEGDHYDPIMPDRYYDKLS